MGGLLTGMDPGEEFRDFVRSRSPSLLRTAFQLTGHRGDAEDLVQTALLRTYVAWQRGNSPDDPYAYTRRILYNSFSRSRRKRRVIELGGLDADVAQSLGGQPEDRDVLRRALASIPPRQRAVLVLRFYEDLSVEQVADLLGISAGTVKSQTSKALSRLRIQAELAPNGAN